MSWFAIKTYPLKILAPQNSTYILTRRNQDPVHGIEIDLEEGVFVKF